MGVKKIGTMTFHYAHNYGAMLQAYALPVAVHKLGYQCEVVDYRFPYIDEWSRIDFLSDLLKKHGMVGGGLRYLKRWLQGVYKRGTLQMQFTQFEKVFIPRSKIIYRDKSQLTCLPYDAILFGSDQIWNSAITNGETPEYLGGFDVLPGTRKIAYAASCGSDDFQEASRATYMELLQSFHAVGVREDIFAKTLNKRGVKAHTVLDPTLLLTKEDWLQMTQRVKKHISLPKKYMLIYAFEEDERLYEVARNIASERDLQIVAIAYNQKKCMHGMQVLTNCGPVEFVDLFSKAQMVVTTSFHGTAFSIIMQRDFYCIPHPKYRARTDSLLEMLGLQARNVITLEDIGKANALDWQHATQKLNVCREESLKFLKNALE